VVGVVLALQCSPAVAPAGPGAGRGARVAQPGRAWRGPVSDRRALPEPGDGEGAAALDRRRSAAMLVATAPAPLAPGQAPPLPPVGPRSPEADLERRRALIGWQGQAQHLLDDCVARPEPTRQQVALQRTAGELHALIDGAPELQRALPELLAGVPVVGIERSRREG